MKSLMQIASNISKNAISFLAFSIASMSSCNPSTLQGSAIAPTESPGVIVTEWTAQLQGTLTFKDHCLRVDNRIGDSFLLVWPRDLLVSLDDNVVVVETGVISKTRKEYRLQIGDQVSLGGGVGTTVNKESLRISAPTCPGPYWIVGGIGTQQTPTP